MNTAIERPLAIEELIAKFFKAIKLMQEGKLPKRTWDYFSGKYGKR